MLIFFRRVRKEHPQKYLFFRPFGDPHRLNRIVV